MRRIIAVLLTAMAIGAGMSMIGTSASAMPPPAESGVSCASVNSTYIGTKPSGIVQSRHLYGRTCERLHGTTLKASVWWYIPNPHHLRNTHIAYASVVWQIWDCTTHKVVLWKALNYGNSGKHTGYAAQTIRVHHGHSYRPRITGAGNVIYGGFGYKYSGYIGGIYAHDHVQPFNDYGPCVGV